METIRATSETVQCTLTAGQQADVGAAWQSLFRTSLRARELVPGGLRLTVAPSAAAELRRLIEIERGCCSWITFAIDGPSVTMTAAGAGEQALRWMWAPEL